MSAAAALACRPRPLPCRCTIMLYQDRGRHHRVIWFAVRYVTCSCYHRQGTSIQAHALLLSTPQRGREIPGLLGDSATCSRKSNELLYYMICLSVSFSSQRTLNSINKSTHPTASPWCQPLACLKLIHQ